MNSKVPLLLIDELATQTCHGIDFCCKHGYTVSSPSYRAGCVKNQHHLYETLCMAVYCISFGLKSASPAHPSDHFLGLSSPV